MAILAPITFPMKPDGRCVVRSPRLDEAASVLAAARDAFSTSEYTLTKLDEFSLTLAQEEEFIHGMNTHPRQLMLIALDESDATHTPIAMSILRQNTTRRKLRHSVELGMSVISRYRGRAVGTALLSACVQWAEAQPDLKLITLDVYAANEPGLKLYRNLGFIECGRRPDGLIHDDGTMWEQVQMYRRV
ncbi:MAG: GNAT family N-acetyltransferase [Phycisphaerales bacterium]|nr:GNAT family N-acetyltransferase [Phycisphaerales bacterium]